MSGQLSSPPLPIFSECQFPEQLVVGNPYFRPVTQPPRIATLEMMIPVSPLFKIANGERLDCSEKILPTDVIATIPTFDSFLLSHPVPSRESRSPRSRRKGRISKLSAAVRANWIAPGALLPLFLGGFPSIFSEAHIPPQFVVHNRQLLRGQCPHHALQHRWHAGVPREK